MSWAELLPFQSLGFQSPDRLRPAARPNGPTTGTVYLSPGGYPDVTDPRQAAVDAREDRMRARYTENRVSATVGVLADRDGYVGAIPAGAGVRLPSIAQPDLAQQAPRGKAKTRGGGRPGRVVNPAPMRRTWEL